MSSSTGLKYCHGNLPARTLKIRSNFVSIKFVDKFNMKRSLIQVRYQGIIA